MAPRKRRPLTPEGFPSPEDQEMEQELQVEQEETPQSIQQELPPDDSDLVEKAEEEAPIQPQIVEEPLSPVIQQPRINRQNRPSFYPKKVEIPSKTRNTPRFS